MAELKTKQTDQNPKDFLNSVEPDQKKVDGFALLELFQKVTGEKPIMWGTSIIGFGKYHYKSERSSQEGDWPLVGFSPRKQNLSLYIKVDNSENQNLLTKLGKHKSSVSCVYINKLADINQSVLTALIKNAYEHMKKRTT